MSSTFAWQDHAVVVAYLGLTIGLGLYLMRKQKSDDDYFLAGRNMPWFAVGLSVIATLLSSLTYLSEPGEVWKSGMINVLGKMLAIPLEMLVVWFICIPFLMRFRYTSAYEYLEDRFGRSSRSLGVVIFSGLVVSWMGFVVLASSRALSTVTGIDLVLVIATVGVVSTIYTVLGGLRAVIWTDVLQVIMMLGGAVTCIGYVAWTTGSGLGDWYQAALTYQETAGASGMKLFSWDPFERSTMVTVALSMFIWHVSTHTANQMAVQRYFSTSSMKAARRSFLTGSLAGVVLNLLLVVVGLALLYFYVVFLGERLPEGLDPAKKHDADLIFPKFVVSQLPPGVAGGIMAALLAAAMSSIDSGVNSLATVICVEWRDRQPDTGSGGGDGQSRGAKLNENHVKGAQWLTFVLGFSVTAAAYGLDALPGQGNIMEMMARTFNAFIGALGGLFFLGMFVPRAGNAAAVIATIAGLVSSIVLGYGDQWGLFPAPLSFALIIPGSLAASILTGILISLAFPNSAAPAQGLTWWSSRVEA